MGEDARGVDRAGRRAKRFLTPLQKYEIWLQLLRQEVTMAERRAAIRSTGPRSCGSARVLVTDGEDAAGVITLRDALGPRGGHARHRPPWRRGQRQWPDRRGHRSHRLQHRLRGLRRPRRRRRLRPARRQVDHHAPRRLPPPQDACRVRIDALAAAAIDVDAPGVDTGDRAVKAFAGALDETLG